MDAPVTQALWQAVMGENPSEFVSPNRPVEQVSFEDAGRFLAAINGRVEGLGLRLPSEAEWGTCLPGRDRDGDLGDSAR